MYAVCEHFACFWLLKYISEGWEEFLLLESSYILTSCLQLNGLSLSCVESSGDLLLNILKNRFLESF